MRVGFQPAYRWWLILGVTCLMIGTQSTNSQQAEQKHRQTLQEWLNQEYALKPKYVKGQERYYRLWQTLEQLDRWGNLQGRSQWRGDLERVVESVDPSGRAEEKITWKNVGSRNWLMAEGKYGPHRPLPWADGFSYGFSAEDGYAELRADYESIPKTPEGMLFRMAFQVSAHLEFDFLRSSRHGAIERLREVGSLLLNPPEDGQKFALDFPPWTVNSDLEKKHVEIGFLGLTQVNGEPCAIIDYKQGPQDFLWETPGSQGAALGVQEGVSSWHTAMKSWHHGLFFVRLRDGSLVSGWLTEPTMGKITPQGDGQPIPRYGRGTWSIQEITAEDYAAGLKDWDQEQSLTPRFRDVVDRE
jgi:hypothetical protein